jgi:signal transduction histidine kinase
MEAKQSKNLEKAISQSINEIVDFSIVLGAVLGSLVFASTIPKIEPGELILQFVINLLIIGSLITIAIFRKRIQPEIKAYIVLLILFIITFIDLLLYGLLSANKIFFVAIPLFSNMVFHIKKTIQIFIFANLLFSAIAYSIIFEVNPLLQSIDKQSYDALEWFINYLELLLLATIILVLFNHFSSAIIKSYNKLDTYKNNLEQLVESRTLELKKKNKELKQLNATKDKFFQILGHDIKAPMSQIISIVDVLKNDSQDLPENMRGKLLNKVTESSFQGLKLLDNILEWAMLQTGQLTFKPEKIEINELITGVVKFLHESAREKNITITNNIDQKIEAYADSNMLKTVFRNLISNAIKFTPEDGKISLNAVLHENGYLFSVKDTGIGMDQETINKLFKIEEKVSTRGTYNEQGTGLGLLLCQEFIEKHGSKIWVESTIGHGSSFQFFLPEYSTKHHKSH